jgi:putative heme transporter
MAEERAVSAGTREGGAAGAASMGGRALGDARVGVTGGSRLVASMPKAGIWAWTFVGVIAALVIIVTALAAVNEIVLPMTFAAVLAIVFKPMAVALTRRRVRPTVAAGIVVLGLLALMVLVAVATVQGVVAQRDTIGASVDEAGAEASESLSVDPATWDAVQESIASMAPTVQGGLLTTVVSGVGSLIGIASGVILGALIMYYLLKDGTRLRRSFVDRFGPDVRHEVDDFIGDTCRILRSYGRGRTIMSASVALVIGVTSLLLGLPLILTIVVVNFIGGYIPYIGAFLGGGLAVIIALGDGGIRDAAIMLLVVLAANLLLENFVEPLVMGSNLDIHPVVVLIVTALGGLVGGIVGLILAVPAAVIAADGFARLRRRGVLDEVADRAQPVVRRALD